MRPAAFAALAKNAPPARPVANIAPEITRIHGVKRPRSMEYLMRKKPAKSSAAPPSQTKILEARLSSSDSFPRASAPAAGRTPPWQFFCLMGSGACAARNCSACSGGRGGMAHAALSGAFPMGCRRGRGGSGLGAGFCGSLSGASARRALL